MKSVMRLVAFALVLVLAQGLYAQQAIVKHGNSGLVNDFANILTPSDQQKLEMVLRDYERRTTNEITFVTVPTLGGMTIEEYAGKVLHEWGVGKRDKHNGIVFLRAVKERQTRIEVGYGLEGDLPDGLAGQILREDVTPKFREQKWAEGVFAGVNNIIAHLDSKAVPVRTPIVSSFPEQAPVSMRVSVPEDDAERLVNWMLVIVSAVAFGAFVIFLARRRKRNDHFGDSDHYDEMRRAVSAQADRVSANEFGVTHQASPVPHVHTRHRSYLAQPVTTTPTRRRTVVTQIDQDVPVIPVYPVFTPEPYRSPDPEPVTSSWPSSDSGSGGSGNDSSSSSFSFGGGDSGGGGASSSD